jgi:hypothetical protein
LEGLHVERFVLLKSFDWDYIIYVLYLSKANDYKY